MMIKRMALATLIAGSLVGASNSAAEAGANIVTFDPPGGSGYLVVRAINKQGTIVGYFSDTNGNLHGFVRTSDGTITTVDAPHSTGTSINEVNDHGTIVGGYTKSDGTADCFLKKVGGEFRSFTIPNSLACGATSINNAGVIAGEYLVGGFSSGFVWHKGVITTFDVSGAEQTYPVQINDAGVITGEYCTGKCGHGFVRTVDGTITPFNVSQAKSTIPSSIDAGGEIVGSYVDKSSVQQAFLREPDGTITTLRHGSATAAVAINKRGQIAGTFLPKNGTTFWGYLGSRDGNTFKKFQVDGDTTFPAGINDKGTIAGVYQEVSGAEHGFVRTR